MSEIKDNEHISSRPQAGQIRFSPRGLLGFVVLVSICCGLGVPAVRAVREAGNRQQCVNNMKQIGIALQNYHDVFGVLPSPHIADANGKPMHSWRAAIHPYMESSNFVVLYDFKQPWNSPKNRGVGGYGRCYACPSENQPPNAWLTNYVMIVGSGTASNPGKWTSLDDITDGLSTTILNAELANSDIFWTEPRDLDFAEMSFKINDHSKASISSHHPNGATVVFADGSVRFLDNSVDAEVVRAMLTKSAGD